jgi:hypothetical protein
VGVNPGLSLPQKNKFETFFGEELLKIFELKWEEAMRAYRKLHEVELYQFFIGGRSRK